MNHTGFTLSKQSQTLKSTHIVQCYFYQILEQARLIYGEKNQKRVTASRCRGHGEGIFWNDKNILSLDRLGGYTGYILGKTRVVHMRFGHFTVCRF